MALKQYKPVTSSQRQLVLNTRDELWKGAPEKSLTEGKKKTGGRNNMGRITTRHIGGGHKQRYRIIDFKRLRQNEEATVLRLEYDPNRTGYIALIEYKDGARNYILAPQRLAKGDKISAGPNADIKPGNALPLKAMPVGTIIHNIEMRVGKGGQLCRSAGCYAQVVGRDSGYVQVKLSSGELRVIKGECMATVGAMSNADHMNESYAKAGRNRWKGIKPTVRGVAMNPVDHPHGGGEGRTSGGRHPVTPWGKGTKGNKTRTNKTTDKFIIRRRKKKNGRA